MRCLEVIAVVSGSAVAAAYKVPTSAGVDGQLFEGFVSYSIEFSSFPEFAGNASAPNDFSYNLINNLGNVMGTKPFIRVGGNTQDYALYSATQKEALIGIVNPNRSKDYPTTITIGKAYFESYRTWPGVKFSHGFNLGLGGNKSEGWQTLVDTAPLACEALSHDNHYTWEYGNEPDLYSVSAQGPVRPKTWDEETYVFQWQNGTKALREGIAKACPQLPAKFMAPSFAALSSPLKEPIVFQKGLDKNNDIELFSTHNYISGAESLGVTLQGTLMNHTRTMGSVNSHVQSYNKVKQVQGKDTPPLMFGECNSLYNQGRPGLSNTFGAALWGVDFNLYSASVGFKRVHMHMGTNYRYQAWQPVETALASKGTKAPYYGSMTVAAMLRNSNTHPVSISSIPLESDKEAAYAAHFAPGSPKAGKLARVVVLNMRSYNSTIDGEGTQPDPDAKKRPSHTYSFDVTDMASEGQLVQISRLLANGSDAITGITYDGWSYNEELDNGKPVRLNNVTFGETTTVKNGHVSVDVLDSSAALLTFIKKC